MSDLSNAEKRYTEKEMIEAQRKSFAASYEWVLTKNYTSPAVIEREALRRYPDPKEPTIVTTEEGWQYRIVEGQIEQRVGPDVLWLPYKRFTVSDILTLAEIAQEYISNTQEKAS